MEKTKVVVTGGAGFIGSHICEYWINNGAEVHVIDNLRTGKPENLAHLPDVVFHYGSITDKALLEKVFRGVTYVHHLAAMVSVPESVDNPEECVSINVNGLLNVLEAAKKYNVRKVVHSSSAAIYGDNPESPKKITTLPEPKSPYGITKLDGEYYLKMYNENYGLGTISLRYFNVFGPRQDPKSQYAAAVPIFIEKAIKNEDIVIFGDGEQTRDFIFVKDVVEANVLAAKSELQTGVFNVAHGGATSINELAKMIIKLTDSKSSIVYASERKGDIKHSLASIEDTMYHLKYFPKHSLESGLKNTVEYF